MKSAEEIMEILEAYDLTGCYRAAGELAGCSHHTVEHWVARRDSGELSVGAPVRRERVVDGFLPKLEELVDRSKGKIRADVAHRKIAGMGFGGSERTTRRAVAEIKRAYRAGRRRVFRPWVAEPGMWAQYDFGDGPRVGGAATVLFCFWLAWSRFRVVLPLADKTGPSVFAAVGTALRRVGGVPTYLLTDNEKTVTVEHVAGLPVRNPSTLAFARHYGLTVATCLPADPASKGGPWGHGQGGQGRPGAHRGQPAGGLRVVRRAGDGLRGVLRAGPATARTGSPAGRRPSCWPRSRPGCTGCRTIPTPRRSG